jgi:hypothetical protein
MNQVNTPSANGGNAMEHLSIKKLKSLAFSLKESGLKNKSNFDTSKWTSLFYQSGEYFLENSFTLFYQSVEFELKTDAKAYLSWV